jgi:polyphenol oxidase
MPVEALVHIPPLLRPAWPAVPGVGAAMSTRAGGHSTGAYASLNLGVAVGDEPDAVTANRDRFARALGARPVWLRQVHGVAVRRLLDDGPNSLRTPHHPADDTPADAAWTTATGVACTVQVADCLPVLLASRDGRAVAAAHAGWRGLAHGVLDTTLKAMHEGAGVAPGELQAWLGPCIGPRQFEVGADVLAAFGVPADSQPPAGGSNGPALAAFFHRRGRPGADGQPRWLADLPGLARARLLALGLLPEAVFSADLCTVEQGSDFFSFRREHGLGLPTGRLAAAIWRRQ